LVFVDNKENRRQNYKDGEEGKFSVVGQTQDILFTEFIFSGSSTFRNCDIISACGFNYLLHKFF